jgi:two-component system response regulator AtoC
MSYDEQQSNHQASRSAGIFLAADPQMLRIRDLCQRVASTSAPVLITGESGVGKEVLARYIHAVSPRAKGPFVKINCAAVPHDLLESELFGHERGAFTGAHQRTEGKFEAARGGTILLDEIGEMDLPLQAKLLHVLEDSSFTRVGGNQPVRMDARILATTNKPLETSVAEKEFRNDLYFRLKVIRIRIPMLRERRADIPLLADHFLRTYADRGDAVVSRLPERLLEAFGRYGWPGNVRELKHVIQRYVILPDVEMVLSELAHERPEPRRLEGRDDRPGITLDRIGNNGKIPLKTIAAKAAEDAEKRVILQVLDETRWNRRRAAARLDICYKTLLNKLDRWQLDSDSGASALTAQAMASGGGPGLVPHLT